MAPEIPAPEWMNMDREWIQLYAFEPADAEQAEWLDLVSAWYRDQAERFSIDLAGAY